MPSQSKIESLLESLANVGSGMIIAWLIMQLFLAPWLGIDISPGQNTVVTLVLTVVSVTRGYFWRRFFSNKAHRAISKFLTTTRYRDDK